MIIQHHTLINHQDSVRSDICPPTKTTREFWVLIPPDAVESEG